MANGKLLYQAGGIAICDDLEAQEGGGIYI